MNSNSGYGESGSIFGTGRGSGIKDFMNSSSTVARFAFVLVVIFVFIILLQLGLAFISNISQGAAGSPHILDGMVDASQLIVIPQDPKASGAITVNRSVNSPNGIEFTWSVWIYITNLQYLSGQYRHIFSKGNGDVDMTTGLIQPNNAPGLYISPNTNELIIIMNTYNVINEKVIVPDIPLNKWVNVLIRCRNTNLDVYINGMVTKSAVLTGVPKQNYGNVYIAMNGGFAGNISNLWYFNYALGTSAIQNIAMKGPNTNLANSNSSINQKNANYLSNRWYFYGSADQFNP
jgi:hypothetical protein